MPTIANLRERSPASIPAVYVESYKTVFFLSVPAFAFLTAVSPLVSRVWLGRYEPIFVAFVALLAAGWLINILSNPAYVVDLGTGALKWVMIGCVGTCALNPALGYMFGRRFGGVAVVAASVASLAIGYLSILVAYHVENRVGFSALLPEHSLPIVSASVAGLSICLPIFARGTPIAHAPHLVQAAAAAFSALALALSMWLHPMRRRLMGWMFSRIAL